MEAENYQSDINIDDMIKEEEFSSRLNQFGKVYLGVRFGLNTGDELTSAMNNLDNLCEKFEICFKNKTKFSKPMYKEPVSSIPIKTAVMTAPVISTAAPPKKPRAKKEKKEGEEELRQVIGESHNADGKEEIPDDEIEDNQIADKDNADTVMATVTNESALIDTETVSVVIETASVVDEPASVNIVTAIVDTFIKMKSDTYRITSQEDIINSLGKYSNEANVSKTGDGFAAMIKESNDISDLIKSATQGMSSPP